MRGRVRQSLRDLALVDLGSTRAAGQLSAVLFFLCGLLVAFTAPLTPDGPGLHRGILVVIGLVAAASGVLILPLPWQRWPRSATLCLVPLAFALIALHNWSTGANGLRYDVFFLVVAAWVGLMHPSTTTLKATPFMVAAYLAPALGQPDFDELATALTYAVPVFILIGECSSLVAERMRASEEELRRSEQRFRALVQNASDVITVIGADGTIEWESPGVGKMLGYEPATRYGSNGLDFIRADYRGQTMEILGALASEPDGERELELPILHADGGWRWCEVRGHNLLHEPAVAGIVINFSDVTERHRALAFQRQLATIVESSSDAITGQALDGTVLSWNRAAERMYDVRADDIVGTNIRRIVPSDRQVELDDLLARVGSGEQLDRLVTTRRRSDGTVLTVSLSMSPVRNSSGNVVSVAVIERDITADMHAADALAHTAASFRLLFFANPQPMWVYDAETLRFLEVNDAAIAHYGWSREQFLAMTIVDVRPAEDVDRLLQEIAVDRELRETAGWRHRLADGRVIEVEVTSHRLDFEGRDAVLVAVQDVTDRNALESQLRHQAFHDTLTGLSNRALFGDRVEHALGSRSHEFAAAVLLLDLDRFKLVNDSLGHAAGDELLVAAANRLQGAVRTGDTVARLGGDEFAILIDACRPEQATEQAQRLLDALSVPLHVGSKQVVVSGSIGIATAEPGGSAGELLRNADMAMYRAKAAGGGCYRMFEPTMHVDALRQMEITASLRQAIDAEQFVLHYQPVVAVGSGDITAMEALVRWRKGDRVLSPAEFIPALEDTGLIVPLGRWILLRACLDAASWGEPALQVNVNLSGRQLADPEIVRHVREALAVSRLPAERLMLEITESVLMQNTEANVRRLSQLRELGVGLAIDDFGTGYSSLAYLRSFPVDELKIDKSFVDTITDDPTAVPLVRTIVQLAQSMRLCTVAEGVETQEQYDMLRSLGCDHVQGYYVARPQPVDEALLLRALPPHWTDAPLPLPSPARATCQDAPPRCSRSRPGPALRGGG